MTKGEMLEIMEERGWEHELTSKNSYEEVKEEFEIMIDEYDNLIDMFPNGYDEEDIFDLYGGY